MVKEPTRSKNLLDLVLPNMPDIAKVSVLGRPSSSSVRGKATVANVRRDRTRSLELSACRLARAKRCTKSSRLEAVDGRECRHPRQEANRPDPRIGAPFHSTPEDKASKDEPPMGDKRVSRNDRRERRHRKRIARRDMCRR